MATYGVLQKLSPEASDGDEGRYGAADVLMVGSLQEAESFLQGYCQRHLAACQEWHGWDDQSRDWDEMFDTKFDAGLPWHAVNTDAAFLQQCGRV